MNPDEGDNVTPAVRFVDVNQTVDVAGAAQFLGVSAHYVYRKTAEGLIPNYKVGKRLQFAIKDLEAFREARKRG